MIIGEKLGFTSYSSHKRTHLAISSHNVTFDLANCNATISSQPIFFCIQHNTVKNKTEFSYSDLRILFILCARYYSKFCLH